MRKCVLLKFFRKFPTYEMLWAWAQSMNHSMGDICQNFNGNMSVLCSTESFLHMKCCEPESKCESLNGEICQILMRTCVLLKVLKKVPHIWNVHNIHNIHYLHIFSPIATLQWKGLSRQQATRLSSTLLWSQHTRCNCNHNSLVERDTYLLTWS
jgi:hypothetical protein